MKNKIIWLFIILNLLFQFGCNEDESNNIKPNVRQNTKIKGFKIIGDDNYPTTIYDFEYRNDTIIKIKYNFNAQSYSEKEIFYNENGIDFIDVTETSSIVKKYTINFIYENGLLIKTQSLKNTNGDFFTDYFYINNKLVKIKTTNTSGSLVKDSTVFSEFDLSFQRPGLKESYSINYETMTMRIGQKFKYIYENGNMIEIYQNNHKNPQKFKLISKTNYNSENSIYGDLMNIASISQFNPYIPNNYDRNNIIDIDYFSDNCNDKTYEDNILYSTLTNNYTRNENGDIDRIYRYTKTYCVSNLFTSIIEFKY